MPDIRPASSPPPGESDRPVKRSRADGQGSRASFPDAAVLAKQYLESEPYKHVSVAGLFDDELLEKVVTESRAYGERGSEDALPGWGWEHKETDIYKIQQTPDLTSLHPDHLPEETLQKLPHLRELKERIYSSEFRQFIQTVTGCGPLSGKKVDGSVGLYTQGSHLLLHDDSISTRVVSYILYLPNSPVSQPANSLDASTDGSFLKGWRSEWGGALELYPVAGRAEVGPPVAKRSAKVDVKWGNLVFFEVQPGRSYHSVEEVVVGDGRQRLGISGWFHKPVEGEDGYVPYDEKAAKANMSSLAQITAAPTIPLTPYPESEGLPTGLTASHLKYLAKFLSPSYLSATNLERLAGQFVEGSEVVMHNFLKIDLATKLKEELQAEDSKYAQFGPRIADQDFGEGQGWTLQGPASKHRYLSLDPEGGASSATPTLHAVLTQLYPSTAFRAWLQVVSSLVVLAHTSEARRFRKGLDYTLAHGEDKDSQPRLDGVLGLTWWGEDEQVEGAEEKPDVGGWECYMASPDEDSDPAVYQSKAAPRPADKLEGEAELEANGVSGDNAATEESASKPTITMGGVELEFDESQLSPSDFDTDSEAGDDDDGPLITLFPGFNKFLLVLRDPGVMRFVKYVSNAAEGSRWDISGEWDVGQLEEEVDDAERAE